MTYGLSGCTIRGPVCHVWAVVHPARRSLPTDGRAIGDGPASASVLTADASNRPGHHRRIRARGPPSVTPWFWLTPAPPERSATTRSGQGSARPLPPKPKKERRCVNIASPRTPDSQKLAQLQLATLPGDPLAAYPPRSTHMAGRNRWDRLAGRVRRGLRDPGSHQRDPIRRNLCLFRPATHTTPRRSWRPLRLASASFTGARQSGPSS
jgi:hypothetical protein